MLEKEKHISTHIAKTGGITVGGFFNRLYGPKEVLIYNPLVDSFSYAVDYSPLRQDYLLSKLKIILVKTPIYPLLMRLNLSFLAGRPPRAIPAEEIEDYSFRCLHGHFKADRFSGQLPNAMETIVFREPLQRTVSHFCHWKRNQGQTYFRVNLPYRSDWSFRDFALCQNLKDYQTEAIGGKSIREFDLVGVTENLDQFALALWQIIHPADQVTSISLPWRNCNPCPVDPETQAITKDPRFVEQFRDFHQQDYYNYQEALERSTIKS